MRLAPLTFHSVIKCAGHKRVLRLLSLGLPLLLCAPLYSQNLGRISGNVNDSGGGVVVGATVTVTDVERGITRTLTTDTAGAYSAPSLIPAALTACARAFTMGFKSMERQGISVGVGQDVHIDLTLQPGEQTQAVTVTADVPTITTTNAQLGGTISGDTALRSSHRRAQFSSKHSPITATWDANKARLRRGTAAVVQRAAF